MDLKIPLQRIALIDGNSFYCSCERAINPKYLQKPLVVLSNNDGCVIARTQEAKSLGIAMGEPWFKVKHLVQSKNLIAQSANFDLYGDLSNRMMNIIGQFSPYQEIYSIDESFLDLSGLAENNRTIGNNIRQRVLQWLGIPCCVGIGSSKTLAKLANHLAKIMPRLQGVCDLSNLTGDALLRAIRHVPVQEVWGVGRRLSIKLNNMGINTAADLATANIDMLQDKFSVNMARTARELNGQPCFDFENMPSPKKQIMCSRSFGQVTTNKTDIEQAIATFANIAANKLRLQNSLVSNILVFIKTSPYRPGKQYSASAIAKAVYPTNNNQAIIKHALAALNNIYRDNYKYTRAGVCLLDLNKNTNPQMELFSYYDTNTRLAQDNYQSTNCDNKPDSNKLMEVIDNLNQRYGKNTITSASTISPRDAPWRMHQTNLSPACTTRWEQILNIYN